MGMQQSVRFLDDSIPTWETVRGYLSEKGYALEMRMINGELAFPDAAPPEDWREIRIGTPHGMVTLRREGQEIVLVTWGNADAGMQQAWNALTWTYAKLGDSEIVVGEVIAVVEIEGPLKVKDRELEVAALQRGQGQLVVDSKVGGVSAYQVPEIFQSPHEIPGVPSVNGFDEKNVSRDPFELGCLPEPELTEKRRPLRCRAGVSHARDG